MTGDPLSPQVVDGDPVAGDLAYRRGWYATTANGVPDAVSAWASRTVGPLAVRIHPTLDHARVDDGSTTVLIVGRAIDTSCGTGDQDRVVRGLYTAALSGRDQLVRAVAPLAGRYVVLASIRGEMTVVPDATATLPAYWYVVGGELHLASHDALIAESAGADIDLELAALMRRARADSPYVVFAPGARSFHRGVRPVLPNHLLTWDGSSGQHRRFYPFPDTAFVLDGYARFVHHFTEYCRLLAENRVVTLSLTGGRDSRASFAALRRVRHPGLSTWTGVRIANPPESELTDAAAAARISAIAGVPHRVIPVSGGQESPEFRRAADRTFPIRMQVRGLAASVHAHLSPETVTVQSMIAGLGAGFYLGRKAPGASPRDLARTYSSRAVSSDPYTIEAFEEFIDYGEFRVDRFGPWDPRDMQYWEHRLPLWSTLRIQELELSHRVELPFNSRPVLEAMASAPLSARKGKYFLQAYEQGF